MSFLIEDILNIFYLVLWSLLKQKTLFYRWDIPWKQDWQTTADDMAPISNWSIKNNDWDKINVTVQGKNHL